MARYLYSELASLIQARANCAKSGNTKWYDRHEERAERLVRDHMPSGSGFDCGTTLDWERSHAERLVFNTAFHHMDENGYYDGWTDHTVTVTPSLTSDFHLRISGRNRNEIKDYISEQFHYALGLDLSDEIAWERIQAAQPDVSIESRWIDQCSQRWDVRRAGVVIASDYPTYDDARREGIRLLS